MAKRHETIRNLRRQRDESQAAFWSRLGVNQASGSRYEKDRDMPPPVKKLYELTYGKKPLMQLAGLRSTTIDQLLKEGTNHA